MLMELFSPEIEHFCARKTCLLLFFMNFFGTAHISKPHSV
jgi:hypothetical protein